MRPRFPARPAFLIAATVALLAPGCGSSTPPGPAPGPVETNAKFPDPTEKFKPHPVTLPNEIPAEQLDAVMRSHLLGLGHMGRYKYRQAADAFREVHERAPGWIPGSINLAIALLNDTGTKAESAKKAGGVEKGNFDEALGLLEEVLARGPENLHAHYCHGLILE